MKKKVKKGKKGMLWDLKVEVCRLNCELPKEGLVTWTSGNVSARDPKTGYVVIKPSGVMFPDLKPEDQVVVDLDGNIIEGKHRPSVDAPTHLHIYRNRPEINGVVHTHSRYATAFAAVNKSIPVYLTAMADEFGCEIPCGPYAKIGSDEIGKTVVKYIGKSPSILLKNHGVFSIGKTGAAALKAAVMTEDVARTVHAALLIGKPDIIPADEVERAHRRYMDKYGQQGGSLKKVDSST